MSDIDIFGNQNQNPQPKDEIRIEAVEAQPYPDRFRVYTKVNVTPFKERPSLILVMRDTEGNTVNELNVIDTMHAEMEFTMHMRGMDNPAGDYTLDVELFYETRNPPQDTASIAFTIPEANEN